MSITAVIVIIIVVTALVVAGAVFWSLQRSRRLRDRFGPEYERVVAEKPNRSVAERELRDREQRHAALDVRPLSATAAERYRGQWSRIQAGFVEDPATAVGDADALITNVLSDRGYPTGKFDDRVDTLSVEHASTLDHYRQAHEISLASQRGEASTEQLRQAVVHYRALATDLLDNSERDPQHRIDDDRTGQERNTP